MPEWLTLISDYAALILVIGGVVAAVGRWTRNAIVAAIEPQLAQINERLDRAERQLQTNGGSSLRDAVSRIEAAQRRDHVLLIQVARAVHAAGLTAPVSVDQDEEEA